MGCCDDVNGIRRSTDLPQLGVVTTGGTPPTGNDKFYLVHPAQASGLDGSGEVPAEGGSLGYSVDSTKTLLFHVVGNTTPNVGEVLIGHYVGNGIWVAERMKKTTTGTVVIPGCSCAVPITLNLHWSPTNCDTRMDNYPQQDATLTYVATPSWASGLVGGAANIFMSNSSFIDFYYGDTYYYYLDCFSGVYRIQAIYQSYRGGPAYKTLTIVTWQVTSNTCSPFSMTNIFTNSTSGPTCTTADLTG